MTDYVVKAGSVDKSVVVFIFDPATGNPDTSVVFNTSGLDLQYRREGAASTAITEVTLAALTTAHTDGGFLHIGNGYYRLDLPDAAVASGVTGVQIHGALTSRAIVGCYIHLVAYDPADTVRLGLTALPNVASGSAGAIPTTGTGSNQLSVSSGHVTLADASLTSGKFGSGAINAAAIASDAITAAKVADGTIDAATFASGAINAAAIASDAITSAKIATGAIDADALATDAVTEIQAGLSTFDHTTDQVLLTTATQDQINAIEASFSGVGVTVTVTGTPTTTSVDISGANLGDTNGDHNRQFFCMTSGGDGVVGIGRWISSYTNTGEGTGTLAFSGSTNDPDGALPNAPSAGTTGVILGRR